MIVGARTGAWAKAGGWVNPYVTDGLVAMWDAEWNAGGGIHDASATSITDLSGNGWDMTISEKYPYEIREKSFVFKRRALAGTTAKSNLPIYLTDDITVEAMMYIPTSEYVWSIRVYAGLLFDHRTGIFSFTRNNTSYRPCAGYSSQYNGVGDRFLPIPSPLGASHTSTIVFRRSDKSIDGFYDGVHNLSLGSQEDNWLGDGTKLTPVFCHEQMGYDWLQDVEINFMRIYSRALSADEITANYAIDKARFGLT